MAAVVPRWNHEVGFLKALSDRGVHNRGTREAIYMLYGRVYGYGSEVALELRCALGRRVGGRMTEHVRLAYTLYNAWVARLRGPRRWRGTRLTPFHYRREGTVIEVDTIGELVALVVTDVLHRMLSSDEVESIELAPFIEKDGVFEAPETAQATASTLSRLAGLVASVHESIGRRSDAQIPAVAWDPRAPDIAQLHAAWVSGVVYWNDATELEQATKNGDAVRLENVRASWAMSAWNWKAAADAAVRLSPGVWSTVNGLGCGSYRRPPLRVCPRPSAADLFAWATGRLHVDGHGSIAPLHFVRLRWDAQANAYRIHNGSPDVIVLRLACLFRARDTGATVSSLSIDRAKEEVEGTGDIGSAVRDARKLTTKDFDRSVDYLIRSVRDHAPWMGNAISPAQWGAILYRGDTPGLVTELHA